MHEYFYTLADAITALLKGDEIYTCTFRGEDSDFVRFNRSAVRQAGTVTQRFLNLDLIRGQRHAADDRSRLFMSALMATMAFKIASRAASNPRIAPSRPGIPWPAAIALWVAALE